MITQSGINTNILLAYYFSFMKKSKSYASYSNIISFSYIVLSSGLTYLINLLYLSSISVFSI